MQDLPLISFPQFFPQATLYRLVSLSASPYSLKILKIVYENRQNRVHQLFWKSACNYMNTIIRITPSQTIDIHGLKSLFSLGRTAMYQLTRDPSFPKAYAITARHFLWDLAEVENWFVSRKGQRPQVRRMTSTNPKDEMIDGIRFVKKVA
ncbi:MAG: AlpA family phage regulatory protein [Streptomycetaceae bacterium]|nr:MAG: AlpA family phage regulatory protein [Streptomycetaceae bacterium]